MYTLSDQLTRTAGIGPTMAAKLAAKDLRTIKDLLLFVPRRYEDRSTQKLIKDLVIGELVTIKAEVSSVASQYRGRRSIQRATVKDQSGSLKLIWFNSPYIKDTLQKGRAYFFSGKLNDRGQMTQPKVEKISGETLHTNRLVPVYSQVPGIKQGNLRRWLKNILHQLQAINDPLADKFQLLPLQQTFKHLHFPDEAKLTVQARERLALEELLSLMQHSQQIKKNRPDQHSAHLIKINQDQLIPEQLPFKLTTAQKRSLQEIVSDLSSDTPMNRLLLGDVGSGKTVVAGIAAQQVLNNQHSVALIAPTQILAEQHSQALQQLFPHMKIELLTANHKFSLQKQPTLYLGTHAVLNHLAEIKPAFVIYDEQHRFGVKQRAEINQLAFRPHVLTMSATPIPRSLMLTIFAHLELSLVDEMPAGRKTVKSWLVPSKKRTSAYDWIQQQLQESGGQALVVCPFIEPSDHENFEQVASVNETFATLETQLTELKLGLLHARLPQKQKEQVIKDLFAHKIDLLVTTPMVEVGIDLPTADVMVIESAERFGLASLHQLRGRVGRAGQQGYCLLLPHTHTASVKKRLRIFTKTHNGAKLAEFDLKNRGAGDLFGVQQHGFDQLQFASWTNLALITRARKIFEQLKNQPQFDWQPLITPPTINSQAALN